MKKEYIFVIVLVLLVVLIFVFSKLNTKVQTQNQILPIKTENLPAAISKEVTKEVVKEEVPVVKKADLQITDLKVGTGEAAKVGDKISVNYLGTFENGQKFDSSYDRNTPFQFNLGKGEVIAGWDQGLVDMKVGGKRKLVIPPDLGYGSTTRGSIPANSVLVFEVELLEIIK